MRALRAAIAVFAVLAVAAPLHAQTHDARGTIWEPWLGPKYKSPRGTKERIAIPPRQPDEPRRIPDMPPPIVVPRTGQAIPNIAPPVPGSGAGGRETFQDRAARCNLQAGVYGAQAGDRGAYMGACVNQ